MFDKTLLIEMLKQNVLDITFEKVDGTLRNMKCTLKESMLPSIPLDEAPATGKVRKINDDVLPVWDTELGAWRSFRVNSVKSVGISGTLEK